MQINIDEHPEIFHVSQKLADAIHLDRAALKEELQSLEKGSVEDFLYKFMRTHTTQVDQLMRAIANLESRLAAVQKASGTDDVSYPFLDHLADDQ